MLTRTSFTIIWLSSSILGQILNTNRKSSPLDGDEDASSDCNRRM